MRKILFWLAVGMVLGISSNFWMVQQMSGICVQQTIENQQRRFGFK